MTKPCFICKEIKPLNQFYAHKMMADGHLNKCKDCAKKEMRERHSVLMLDPKFVLKERARQRAKEARKRSEGRVRKETTEEGRNRTRRYRAKHGLKYKAHSAVGNALRAGNLVEKPCDRCGAKAEAHHDDYSKPLDVTWLCPKHHAQRHVELREQQLMNH